MHEMGASLVADPDVRCRHSGTESIDAGKAFRAAAPGRGWSQRPAKRRQSSAALNLSLDRAEERSATDLTAEVAAPIGPPLRALRYRQTNEHNEAHDMPPSAVLPSNSRQLVFTSSQAARYLGVSLATIRRWTDSGHISCYRTPGGQRRFARAQLDDFISSMHRDGSSARAGAAGAEREAADASVREQPGIRVA
jgi:excisionase family DNA binding protein